MKKLEYSPPDTQIFGRTPPPSGPDADLLMIGDYLREYLFNFLPDPAAQGPGCKAAREALVRVDKAHDAANLVRAPDRAGDSLTRDVRLGAECLGYLGHEGSPRIRRINLIVLLKNLLKIGLATGKLLRILSSLLINIFRMRRPLMSLLEGIFEYESDDALTVFVIPARLLNQVCLSICALLMAFSDVRSGYDPELGSLDASEERGGTVKHLFTREGVRGLSRFEERKPLVNELNYDAFIEDSFDRLEASQALPSPHTLGLYFHTLELWGDGDFSRAASKQGAIAGPVISLKFAPECDLLDPNVVEWVLYMLDQRRILWLHMSPPAATPQCVHQAITQRLFVFQRVALRHELAVSFVLPPLFHSISSIIFARQESAINFQTTNTQGRPLSKVICNSTFESLSRSNATPKNAAAFLGSCAAVDVLRRELRLRSLAREEPPPIDRLWISDVMESLPWPPQLKFQWKALDAITTLESRTANSWIKEKVRRRRSGCCLGFMDSRASTFSGRKGRARKKRLNRVWKGTGCLCVAGGLYPIWNWGRTKWNRGDAPTRNYRIPEPKREEAAWLKRARKNQYDALRLVAKLRPMAKHEFPWGRFVFNKFFLGSSTTGTCTT